MQKKKYTTSAESNGFSWILATQISNHVMEKWSSESADPWWLAVKGAQWDRVRYFLSQGNTGISYRSISVIFICI